MAKWEMVQSRLITLKVQVVQPQTANISEVSCTIEKALLGIPNLRRYEIKLREAQEFEEEIEMED